MVLIGQQFLVLKPIYGILAWGTHTFEVALSVNRILFSWMHSSIIIALHPCDYMCVQRKAIFLPQATLAVSLDSLAIDWNAKSL